MFRNAAFGLKSRQGFAFALVVVFIPVFIGTMALAIDLGMMRVAKAEAQRAADAAALAGASAYLDFIPATAAVDSVQGRAIDYAMRNTIRNQFIQGGDVGVNVDPANFKVTVSVRSIGLPMWFGSFFGLNNNVVTAEAAAVAAPAGGVKCVKPFAIPDLWNELTLAVPEDADADRRWDTYEGWNFDSGAGDSYRKWDISNPGDPVATGYHSNWRHQIGSANQYDEGLVLTIKAQRPGQAITSGFFYPWRIGNSTGGQDYEDNITGCNPSVAQIGVPYSIEPGNMVGKTRSGINQLMGQDPGATWDPTTATVIGCHTCSGPSPNWQASPRVIIAGLFDPNLIAGIHGASQPIVFSDFALFFLEGFDPAWTTPPLSQAPVLARFIGFAKGTDDGAAAGTLLRILRLVE